MEKLFPVADGHCDFLYGMVERGYDLAAPKQDQAIRLDKLIEGGVKLQLFAAWIDMLLDKNPLNQCLCMIDAYYRMLGENPILTPLTKDFDIAGDRIATVLTVEGGEAKAERVLELNPDHPVFEALSRVKDDEAMLASYAGILYGQAQLLAGLKLDDPAKFAGALMR